MSNIHMIIKRLSIVSVALLISCIFITGSQAQTLSASTSVTIVNVTKYPSSYPIEDWPAWPNDPDDVINPQGYELYINKVDYHTGSHMSWNPTPYPTPYPVFPNTINSMIAAVYSLDGGKTFSLQSWDYLQRTSTGKGTHGNPGMPSCWMGAMVHSLCDRKPGECNGRYRSNLYFSSFPHPTETPCYGSSNPQ